MTVDLPSSTEPMQDEAYKTVFDGNRMIYGGFAPLLDR